MRNIVRTLMVVLLLTSCKKETPKDYVSLSGTLANATSDSLVFFGGGVKSRKIKINKDGTFKDTIKLVKENNFVIYQPKVSGGSFNVYLKNGFDLKVTGDFKDIANTVTYEGVGEALNRNGKKRAALSKEMLEDDDLYYMDEKSFLTEMEVYEKRQNDLMAEVPNTDSIFIKKMTVMNSGLLKTMYDEYEKVKKLWVLKGTQATKFTDYENYKGGTTSLDDLLGKYVYIDLWATWCGPCIQEIPALKKMEREYHDKNIEFVSISVDDKKDYEKWRKMVSEKELGGVQLFSNRDTIFTNAYFVNGIPRFILIDTEGKVVDADAPRPSSKMLKKVLDTFNL